MREGDSFPIERRSTMSAGDKYFTAPLAILRSGTSALEALSNALDFGIVSAGIGYQQAHDADEFETLLDEAKRHAEKQNQPTKPPPRFQLRDADGKPTSCEESQRIWFCALAGAKLLGVNGGNREWDSQIWATHHRPDQVFFKIKSEWLWNAIYTARRDAGKEVETDHKPLSFREFRILAGILSAPVSKSAGFVFLGWESVQARSCGFHRKDLFQAGRDTLPMHCQPLSRDQISRTTEALEALKFFLRFRYSKGDRGGKTAYSLRHESREKLAEAVGKFQAEHGFKSDVANNRAKDRELSARIAANLQPPSK